MQTNNEIEQINNRILNEQLRIANNITQIDNLRQINETSQCLIDEWTKRKIMIETLGEGGNNG